MATMKLRRADFCNSAEVLGFAASWPDGVKGAQVIQVPSETNATTEPPKSCLAAQVGGVTEPLRSRAGVSQEPHA
jgi:hypothetical protein